MSSDDIKQLLSGKTLDELANVINVTFQEFDDWATEKDGISSAVQIMPKSPNIETMSVARVDNTWRALINGQLWASVPLEIRAQAAAYLIDLADAVIDDVSQRKKLLVDAIASLKNNGYPVEKFFSELEGM